MRILLIEDEPKVSALVKRGLIAERWGGLDTFSLLQQLGVVGAPARTAAARSAH